MTLEEQILLALTKQDKRGLPNPLIRHLADLLKHRMAIRTGLTPSRKSYMLNCRRFVGRLQSHIDHLED